MSSEETIRDVLFHKQDHFSDRPPSFRNDIATQGHSTAFISDSPRYRFKKNHMMRAMKLHGDGLKHLEETTLSLGLEMLKKMEAYAGNAFAPYDLVRLTTGAIIMTLTYGYSTESDVHGFCEIEENMMRMMKPSGSYLMLDIFPSLRYCSASVQKAYKELLTTRDSFIHTFRSFTNVRKQNKHQHGSKSVIEHFIDLEDETRQGNIQLGETDTLYVGVDLLIAGVSTTSNFLTNILGILVNHPSIQDKSYEEIIRTIGKRPPHIDDRKNTPYLESVILEAFRYTSFVPLLIPHYTSCETELNGYLMPKGTIVFPNVWSLHHDEKYWEDPWVFNPNRFLDENGDLVGPDHINKQRLLIFGAGRRQCTGEIFARNRVYILLALMLQNFKFLPANGHPRPKHDPRDYDVRMNILIKPYHLSATIRE